MHSPARTLRIAVVRCLYLCLGEQRALPRAALPVLTELMEAREMLEEILDQRSPVVSSQAETYLACAQAALARALDSEHGGAHGDAETAALLGAANVSSALEALDLEHSPVFATRSNPRGTVPCPDCWHGDRAPVTSCSRCRGVGFVPLHLSR